ncbi:MAG: HD domain-containing protein [Candidatus Micrarchaeia archaeon]
MLIIKDALHGGVRLSQAEAALLDSKPLQRLRGVRQLALASLVYPGANHTRFEHSLGTAHLAGRLCGQLSLPPEDAVEVRAAALLHDVGHPAFSHELEELAIRFAGKGHEAAGREKIVKGEIAGVLEKNGLSPAKIGSLAVGRGLGCLITGELGSDRMDYLARDAYYTGVAFGVVDSDRIIECTLLRRGRLLVDEGGLAAAEALLAARFLMFSAVYLHHTVRIASAMLYKAAEQALEEGEVPADSLLSHTDSAFFHLLKNAPSSRALALALEERRLFKRAFEVHPSALSESLRRALRSPRGLRKIERELAAAAGASAGDVIIDFPLMAWEKGVGVRVLKEGKERRLEELSELVASLKRAEASRAGIIVACPKKSVERVRRACRRIFA